MHITTEVHIPHGLCPALGMVTDWDTMITMVFHHGAGDWTPVCALRAGSSDVITVPTCFEIDAQVLANLNVRMREAREGTQTGADLDDLVIKDPVAV